MLKKIQMLLPAVFFVAAMLFTSVEAGAQFTSMPSNAPKFRVALQGGYAYCPVKLYETGNEVIDVHNKRLKSGLYYGADLSYYLSDAWGFGFRYSNMESSSKDAVIVTDKTTGESRSGMYTDIVDITFAGPTLSSRFVNLSGTNVFYLSCGIGYLGYSDEGKAIDPFSIKGWTVGQCADFGYDCRLWHGLYLGASLSAVVGVLSNITVNQDGVTETQKLEKDEQESLLHVSLSIGIRYYL